MTRHYTPVSGSGRKIGVVERWKTVKENNRYEISDYGRVRVREQYRNPSLSGSCIVVQYNKHRASAWVDLWSGSRHTTRVMWKLLEKYWPGVEYPDGWKKGMGRSVALGLRNSV